MKKLVTSLSSSAATVCLGFALMMSPVTAQEAPLPPGGSGGETAPAAPQVEAPQQPAEASPPAAPETVAPPVETPEPAPAAPAPADPQPATPQAAEPAAPEAEAATEAEADGEPAETAEPETTETDAEAAAEETDGTAEVDDAAEAGDEEAAEAADSHGDEGTPHYPLKHPREVSWSFAGPFGKYDKAQLQRGLKVYAEVCAACHSLNLVPFRTLSALGYSEDQIKAFAANYEVQDGPNEEGEMFTRPAIPSDHFPSPYANQEAAAYSNNGAAPPDFSLIAKARGVTRGFPQFVFDIFTQYQEGGTDYIYSLLTGYEDEAPEGVDVPEGTYYNPYFLGSASLAMAPPIADDQVTYDDGSPQTLDQYARDVSAFLMWTAEPHLEARKRTGFMVMVFLAIFTILLYLTKKSVYASKPD